MAACSEWMLVTREMTELEDDVWDYSFHVAYRLLVNHPRTGVPEDALTSAVRNPAEMWKSRLAESVGDDAADAVVVALDMSTLQGRRYFEHASGGRKKKSSLPAGYLGQFLDFTCKSILYELIKTDMDNYNPTKIKTIDDQLDSFFSFLRCPYIESVLSKHEKKRGAPFPHRKPLRKENGKWNILYVYRLLGPIAVPIRESPTNSREAINITPIFENCTPSTARRGGCHSAMSRTFHDDGCPLQFGRHIAISP
jgi:hypothetical protein